MRLSKLFIIICLMMGMMNTASPQVAAPASASFERHLRALVFDLEKEMTSTLEEKLGKVLGRKSFWLTLTLSVDRARLQQDFAKMTRNFERQKGPSREGKSLSDLPGLPMGKNGAPVIRDEGQRVVVMGDGPELTRSLVLSYVSDVLAEVAIDKDNEKSAQTTLRKLVTEYFRELNIPVALKFNRKKIAGLFEVSDESLDAAKKDGKPSESWSTDLKLDTGGLARDLSNIVLRDFFNTVDGRYGKIALIIAGAFLALIISMGMLMLWVSSRNSKTGRAQMEKLVKSMSDSLSGLSMGGSSGGLAETAKVETTTESDVTESETELMAQIRDVLLKSPQLTGHLLKFFFRERMFENCLLVLQCLGPEYLAWPKKEIPEDLFLEFIVDLREKGGVYFTRDRRLESLKGLYLKIWQASFNIANLLVEEIRSKLKTFGNDDAVQLLTQCNLEETSSIVEMLRPEVVAHAVNSGRLTPETLGRLPSPSLNRDILKAILEKVSNVGGSGAAKESYLEKVAQYLPLDLEKKLFASAGMPSGLHLEDLARDFNAAFTEEVAALSLDDLTQLLAIVTPELKAAILKGLPEIKARRMEQRKLEATPHGIEIKGALERKLKQLHPPEKWGEYQRYLKSRLEDRKKAQRFEASRVEKMERSSGDGPPPVKKTAA
ncbi:MAG: hypothetical protein A2X86_18015 [Bdellovibrionales bacterium GWA2_49_15]|nr:MAG: hypothetical protein A2X86_18015 [Bdellovibrionales bacterium GWA2_49_15]HAZ11621.1 hypothetical protein [Bdellovibrionales bacterium]